MKTSRSVDEHHIGTVFFGSFDGFVAYACRVAAPFARNNSNVSALGPHLKLFNSSSAERVCTTQENLSPLLMIRSSKLTYSGSFTCPIDADEQNQRWILLEDISFRFGKRRRHLIGKHIEHRIGIGKRLTLCLIS